MTNIEKAQEIAEEYRAAVATHTDCFDENDRDCLYEDMYENVLNMAEWKDRQFEDYIEVNKQPVLASETDDTVVGYSIDVDKIFEWLKTVQK